MWVDKYIPYVHMYVHPNGLSNNGHDIQLKAEHVFVWEGGGSLSPYWYTHWIQAVSDNVYLISSNYTVQGKPHVGSLDSSPLLPYKVIKCTDIHTEQTQVYLAM